MDEVMIDIETLDTERTSVVLSIGLMAFDRNGKETQQLTVYPRVDEQLKAGRTVSLATVKFWVGVGPGPAVDETFLPESARTSVAQSREEVVGFLLECLGMNLRYIGNPETHLQQCKNLRVWANGDKFDLGIVEDLLGLAPWAYNSPRDLRTVLSEAKDLGWVWPLAREDHAPHSAMSDCRFQIDCLMSARRFHEAKIGFRHD